MRRPIHYSLNKSVSHKKSADRTYRWKLIDGHNDTLNRCSDAGNDLHVKRPKIDLWTRSSLGTFD